MNAFEESVITLARGNTWSLPVPGSGSTALRHRTLAQWGRDDLNIARIAEAHTDALAILAEAGLERREYALYGVWASDGPQSRVTATRLGTSSWRLDGIKQYCSGAPFLSAALITAHADDGLWLFDVPLHQPGIIARESTWASPALADTATGPVTFDAVEVTADEVLGGANWYLARPGFWHGAVGPAACWAGGGLSLVDAARRLKRSDPHSRAQLGALEACAWNLEAILDTSGREIDEDAMDTTARARPRALMVRHLIERICTEILDRFGRATGPQLLAYDARIARQHAGLVVYIRQCHAERDLETIPVV